MSEILLVNPRRRRKTTTRRKRRPAARRRNPVKRRRTTARRRRNPGYALRSNPRRKRRYSRRRSNPAPRMNMRSIQGNLMNALPGAFGALGLDVLMGYIPLPANFKGGFAGYITKSVGAIGLGMLANMSGMVRASTAAKMTEGALTVMFHGAMRQAMTQFAPQIPLGMYLDESQPTMGYYGAGWNPDIPFNTGGSNSDVGYLPDISAGQPYDTFGLDAYANAEGEF